ncbi:MAG: ABC transporter permease [Caldilineaceae bacterium]
MKGRLRNQFTEALLIPALAVISGLVLASVFVLFTGVPPLTAYAELFKGGFSCAELTRCNLFQTLQLATPLMLTGLSAVIAFRSGMFSIGQEGQFLIGAVAAAWLGYAIHLPPVLHPAVVLIAAMAAAGVYGWIPGVLKVRLGVNEVITTIILNNIANLFAIYMVNFPLRADASTSAHSPLIDATAQLPVFFPGSKWGVGFILALLAALFVYVYLWRSKPGYEQRMAGQAPLFALYGGIPSNRAAIRGMVLSGALSGLAGAIEILGVHRRLLQGFSAGLGFDGLMVAILGRVHPLGVLLVSILFAGVRLGAQIGLQTTVRIPRELGGGIIALIILFVAAEKFYQGGLQRVGAWFARSEKRVISKS